MVNGEIERLRRGARTADGPEVPTEALAPVDDDGWELADLFIDELEEYDGAAGF